MSLIQNCIRILRKPSILMPLVTILCIVTWLVLLNPDNATATYDRVSAKDNLLSNYELSQFEDGKPRDWEIANSGDLTLNTTVSEGTVDPGAVKVEVSDYVNGAAYIATAPVEVDSTRDYFFKAFYVSDTRFDLLAESTYTDGSTTAMLIREYPDYDYPLSTMSARVTAPVGVVSMRFMIVLNTDGYINIDSAYVIAQDTDEETANQKVSENLLSPATWTYAQGNGVNGVGTRTNELLEVSVAGTENGAQAGWQPDTSVAVATGQHYELRFSYTSDVPVQVGIDYDSSNGTYGYEVLQELHPTPVRTQVTIQSIVTNNMTSFRPSLQLKSPGQLTSSLIAMHKLSEAQTFDKPRVSITFDDGWLSSYQNGARIADEYGFSSTFFVNPGTIGRPGFLNNEDITQLSGSSHDIASHGLNHIDLTLEARQTVTSDLVDAYTQTQNYGVKTVDFASPYGKVDALSMETIRSTYRSHRGTQRGINYAADFDVYNMKVLFIDKGTQLEDVQYALDQTALNNGWLILVYHQIEPAGDFFTVDKRVYTDHLDLIQTSGIQVQTIDQVLSELGY